MEIMTDDLFDTLADNAWTLPTADGHANLHVTELGHGDPVVVLHGGPGVHYGYLVDAIRRLRYEARFILFDQRGSLLSAVPSDQISQLSPDQLVADLETLRLTLGRERLRLLGHSWGALLAQLYYQAHPDRVEALILTGTGWPFTPPPSYEAERVARQEQLRTRPEVAEILHTEVLGGDPEGLTPQQRSLWYRITGLASFSIVRLEKWRQVRAMHWNRRAAIAIDAAGFEYDVRPVLGDYPIPIMIIQGDHDYLDPAAEQWQQLRREHPTVQVNVMTDAGHSPWIDDPSAFDQALGQALSAR